MRLRHHFVAALFAFVIAVPAHGDTLASVTGGQTPLILPLCIGQTFSVFGAGDFTDATFNFYDPSGNAYAIGTGYLLATAYTGTPAALSSATPGFLGSAQATNGLYSFGSQVTLTAGQTYFFYEDAEIAAGAITGGPTSSGLIYEASSPDSDFGPGLATTNYLVTGIPTTAAPTPTPEPFPLVLLGTGLAAPLAVYRRTAARRLFCRAGDGPKRKAA